MTVDGAGERRERESFQDGRYVVRKEIGTGAFSRVLEAYDVDRDERVALKVLSVAGTHRSIAEAMFKKEVGALEGLEHPAIVRLLRHFPDPQRDALVIVLELVAGGRNLLNLIEDVRRGIRPRPPLVWRTEQLLHLLRALDLAHDRGVVHRDVKPGNVLVTEDDRLMLADFGIARVFDNYGRGVESLTLRDFFTHPYAAPEQVRRREATPASDIHAFSVLATAVLGMELPDERFDQSAVAPMLRGLDQDAVAPAARGAVEELLRRGLEEDPARRPRTHEIERGFEDLLAGVRPRTNVWVRFSNAARDSAQRCGFETHAAVLEDLNREVRAEYKPTVDDGSGEQRGEIICLGQNLEVTFVMQREAPDRLLAKYVKRLPPPILARRRQSAVVVPVVIAFGDGSSEALIQAAFDAFEAAGRERAERGRIRELFALGRFVLERQRAGMLHLRIRCRPHDRQGRRRGGRQRGSHAGPMKGIVPLRVIDVHPWDASTDGPDDLPLRWAEALDERSTFLLKGRRAARFRSFDPAEQLLVLDFEEPVDTDEAIELELRDIALETALRRQEDALRAVEAGQTPNPRLRALLLNPAENRIERVTVDGLVQPDLRPPEGMRDLVERVLGAEDMVLIQGPPGTGKTTLIAEVVAQILRRAPDHKILLAAQAHDAVDNALERLEELAVATGHGWRMVRDLAPESRKPGRRGFEESFRNWADRVRERSIAAFEGERATLSADQAAAVDAALSTWRERLDQTMDVREDFARSVQVFATTCLRVPAVLRQVRDQEFDWVIVDEAAKATPTEVLVPMVAGKRIVLVGDHRQLPPFLDADIAEELRRAELDPDRARVSLFEDMFKGMPKANRETLRVQFRMHRSIGRFVGELFYPDVGGLETGVADEERGIDLAQFDTPNRVWWFDVDGRPVREGTSWYNDTELAAVERLLRRLERPGRAQAYEVAVIAPYLAQVDRLRRMGLRGEGIRVTCATVDAFQGKQVDVVVYSLVRDVPDGAHFVTDPRRLNVAFSRCKRLLLIIGSQAGAERSTRLRRVLEAVPRVNRFKLEARR